MPPDAAPAVLPTSPTQDGTTPTPSDPPASIIGGAGEPAPHAQTGDQTQVVPPSEPPAALTWADLELPDTYVVDEPLQAEFLGILNNRELTPKELARQTLAMHDRLIAQAGEQMQAQWDQTQEQWRQEVAAMPEFQGGRMEQELSRVAKLVDKYGGKAAREAFDLTGAGNNPALVKMLHRIAQDILEEEPISGQPVVVEARSRAERLYGNQGGQGGNS